MTNTTQINPLTANRVTILQHALKIWNQGVQEFTDEEVVDIGVAFMTSYLMNLGKDFSTFDHLSAAMKAIRDERAERNSKEAQGEGKH